MTDWNRQKDRHQRLKPIIAKKVDEWTSQAKYWSGIVILDSYPPRLKLFLEVIHVNQLSDAALRELGVFVTKLCECHGLQGHTHNMRASTKVMVTLWLPVENSMTTYPDEEIPYNEDANMYECINCGATAKTRAKIRHYINCQPGDANRWASYYGKHEDEEPWACPNCEHKNPIERVTCEQCGHNPTKDEDDEDCSHEFYD